MDFSGMSQQEIIYGALGTLALLFMYFLPTMIGFLRGASSKWGILILDLFLGWSLIGWVIALIWSVIGKKKNEL
jgi:hypothetical protein